MLSFESHLLSCLHVSRVSGLHTGEQAPSFSRQASTGGPDGEGTVATRPLGTPSFLLWVRDPGPWAAQAGLALQGTRGTVLCALRQGQGLTRKLPSNPHHWAARTRSEAPADTTRIQPGAREESRPARSRLTCDLPQATGFHSRGHGDTRSAYWPLGPRTGGTVNLSSTRVPASHLQMLLT